jgi:hypothetical protein
MKFDGACGGFRLTARANWAVLADGPFILQPSHCGKSFRGNFAIAKEKGEVIDLSRISFGCYIHRGL